MSQGLFYLDKLSKKFIPNTQYNEYPLLEQSAIFHIYEKEHQLYIWNKKKEYKLVF